MNINNSDINDYIRKYLKKYIVFSLSQGYDIEAIKSSLIKQGNKKKFLKSIIEELPHTRHTVKETKYDPRELDRETKYYLEGVLAEYIERMIEHGYEKSEIKRALINYGHHPSVVNEALRKFKKPKIPIISFEGFSFANIMVYMFFVVFLVMGLDAEPISLVFFLPGLIGVFVSIGLLKRISKKNLVPLFGFLTIVIVFIGIIMLLINNGFNFNNYDIQVIMGVNIVLGTLISFILSISYDYMAD